MTPSDKNSKAYALWQTRCQIFGSDEVAEFAQKIVDTNDGSKQERRNAFQGLLNAIKRDLHVVIIGNQPFTIHGLMHPHRQFNENAYSPRSKFFTER